MISIISKEQPTPKIGTKETELKYSTSQRILFETAVLKAAMPQEDYDIEALIARISALEKQLAEGVVVQNVGGMSATNAKKRRIKPWA